MKFDDFVNNSPVGWHFKYLGIPMVLGYTCYRILTHLLLKKGKVAIRGKVVLITGASSGIGEALAHVFYENGCKVILSARRESELKRVKNDLMSKKLCIPVEEPLVMRLDCAELDTLSHFVDDVHELCGKIDIMIHNAGVTCRGPILQTKVDVDKQIMYTNYFGPVILTKAALPKMVANKSGYVVFISSVQGLIAIPDRAAYAASKHAIQAFGDSLRAEMKQHNINVSVVSPGYVKTAVSINALTASGEKHGVMDDSTATGFTPEYVAEKTLDMIANNDAELVISQFIPKLAIFMRHNIPSLYFWLMSKRALKTNITN